MALILREWSLCNGVIVIFANEAHLFPASVEMYKEEDEGLVYFELLESYHQQLKHCLSKIAADASDVHIALIGSRYLSDERWPPGMFACAQRLFGIDLNLSVFVGSDLSVAKDLSLSTIRDDLFFQKSGWNVSDRLRKMGTPGGVQKNSDWLFTRLIGEGEKLEFDVANEAEVAGGRYWMTLSRRNEEMEEKRMKSNIQRIKFEEEIEEEQIEEKRMEEKSNIQRIKFEEEIEEEQIEEDEQDQQTKFPRIDEYE